ncbi:MAG: hypothetical protein K2J11_11415 [Oscillospiraceae bacterium]|nr:hypothetical protein [Oscillospiraceae bacterium]
MNFGITGNLGGYSSYVKTVGSSTFNKKNTAEETTQYSNAKEYDKVSFSKEGYEKYSKSVSKNEQENNSEAIIDELQEQDTDIEEAENTEKPADEQEEQSEQDEIEGEQVGGCVGINADKLARMLAAAKTRSQVQAVIAKIQADLNECEAGKNNNMDVDEASVKAAKQLLQEAKSRMGSAENREATPEEEMAAALAALM